MATIKVACPKCGQKVSGDEGFFGTSVDCPICSAEIKFPGLASERSSTGDKPVAGAHFSHDPVPSQREDAPAALPPSDGPGLPPAFSDEVVPQAQQSEPETNKVEGEDEEFDDQPSVVSSPIFGAISIVSAVLGIVTCVGGILFAPIAIIFGHVAGAKARQSPVHPAPGQTLGAVGMMIGYVNLVFTILFLVVIVGLKEFNPDFNEWMKDALNRGE